MSTYNIFLSAFFMLSSVESVEITSAVIDNGVIMLGINQAGQLNVDVPNEISTIADFDYEVAGLAYLRDDGIWWDSTSYGQEYEGWGASATKESDDSSFYGGANQKLGVDNIDADSMKVTGYSAISGGSSATTVAKVTSGPLKVTHVYAPSSVTTNAYEMTVTLENTDGEDTLKDIRYRRTMDWDIEPTKFEECVSIFWNVRPNALESATFQGFSPTDPRVEILNEDNTSDRIESPVYDKGPKDQGADFIFLFKDANGETNLSLGPGETLEFKGYFGAAGSKADADDVVNSIGSMELISYGYPNVGETCSDKINGEPNTFFFGFASIGGEPITIGGSNEPSESPSDSPSMSPSVAPSDAPSESPSTSPSVAPSDVPSESPSTSPSESPSDSPSMSPSVAPSDAPSESPSTSPSVAPSDAPSESPSTSPSESPSDSPSMSPSVAPSDAPSESPSQAPSRECEYRSAKDSKSASSKKNNKKCEKAGKKQKKKQRKGDKSSK